MDQPRNLAKSVIEVVGWLNSLRATAFSVARFRCGQQGSPPLHHPRFTRGEMEIRSRKSRRQLLAKALSEAR